MTPSEIVAKIRLSTETLRRLPPVGVSQKVTLWPDVLSDWSGYGWNPAEYYRVSPPTASEISDLDLVLGWMIRLDERTRRIIWARSCGIGWKKISRIAKMKYSGWSVRNLQILFKKGIEEISKG